MVLDALPELFPISSEVLVGPGDDCAALDFGLDKLRLLAVDQLVSNVHYDKKTTSPAEIAGKLLRRNISDIAAMGGLPSQALLAMTLSKRTWETEGWVKAFLSAISAEAEHWGINVCGGDISSTIAAADSFSLTITGWVERKRLTLRSGARPGDQLYATGEFGNSYNSGHHLNFAPRLDEARFLADGFADAMIDVSDGLLMDAARIADSSGLELRIDESNVPLRGGATLEQAFSDGEDYELLVAVPPEKAAVLETEWPFASTNLTRIGSFVEIKGATTPTLKYSSKQGFAHFEG